MLHYFSSTDNGNPGVMSAASYESNYYGSNGTTGGDGSGIYPALSMSYANQKWFQSICQWGQIIILLPRLIFKLEMATLPVPIL